MKQSEAREVAPTYGAELNSSFEKCISGVRDDVKDNPYLQEAMKVLRVGGLRSAIGCFWNAVVDDLRNKVIFRSLNLFNKEIKPRKEIKTYEDFQDHINDDELIDGAYKIGVISWEAHKVLKHAKETRHIFDGHPKSSEPSLIKVLAMMEDCIKYVLSIESPPQIIDIDEYIATMNEATYSRNVVSIENALGDLPETYKNELANRLFTAYIISESSTTLKSNIEFIVPILWNVLPKEIKIQVVRRIDSLVTKADTTVIENAFNFVRLSNGEKYLSTFARRTRLQPTIEYLEANLDNWSVEDKCIEFLEPYAPIVPEELLDKYVSCLVHTYVGTVGLSHQFQRTDFYANGASVRIPRMIEAFDNSAASAFVMCVTTSLILKQRLRNPAKFRRLQTLTGIVLERVSASFKEIDILKMILDEEREKEFFKIINRQ